MVGDRDLMGNGWPVMDPLRFSAREPPMGTPAIGIDFGTSNTAAAVLDGLRPRIIRLEDDQSTLPTAVMAAESSASAGRPAPLGSTRSSESQAREISM